MRWFSLAALALALVSGGNGVLRANPLFPARPFPPQPAPSPLPGGPFQPVVIPVPVVVPVYRPVVPQPGPIIAPIPPMNRKALERYVEGMIQGQLGHLIQDVDVDIDRRGRVRIEVESDYPFAYRLVYGLVHTLPQLRGLLIEIDID
jgi:hypothetical protein